MIKQPTCLSVRQPWAWLIVNGWKNVENRTRRTAFRGRVFIHASLRMTKGDYDACVFFVASIHPFLASKIPPMSDLPRGGIVGETTILDCVDHHSSEWFTGPFGWVLSDTRTTTFEPLKGRLGFFAYKHRNDS